MLAADTSNRGFAQDCIRMLCRAGSKIDFAGLAGLSPLMMASSGNSVAAVKVLWLIYGAMESKLITTILA